MIGWVANRSGNTLAVVETCHWGANYRSEIGRHGSFNWPV